GWGSDNIDASHNWWGSTNATWVGEKIYDYYDDFNKPKIIYEPFLVNPFFPVNFPPVIDHPSEIVVYIGDPITVLWTVSDYDPSYYLIYVDSSLQVNNSWITGNIEYNFGPMWTTGVYMVECVVWDQAGNHVSDTVKVIIEESTTSTELTTTLSESSLHTSEVTSDTSDLSTGETSEPPLLTPGFGLVSLIITGIVIILHRYIRRET
ncbi:MAG: hypothetical protein ACXAC8_13510, partial [Candidatus Hodarchaeales archaeon]